MVVFLYGPDSYRRQKELRRLLNEHKSSAGPVTIRSFDFEECRDKEGIGATLGGFYEFARSVSLFGGDKVAVLRGLESVDARDFKEFLKSAAKDQSITVFISEEKSLREDFPFLHGKTVTRKEFKKLDGTSFREFVKEESESQGARLSPEALRALAGVFAGDSWGAVTELQKLACVSAEGKRLDVQDLEAVQMYRESPSTFSFVNSIEQMGSLARIRALEALFVAREDPAKIFNYLGANRYLSSGLVARLADYDIAVKSGKLEYEEVLLDLALQ